MISCQVPFALRVPIIRRAVATRFGVVRLDMNLKKVVRLKPNHSNKVIRLNRTPHKSGPVETRPTGPVATAGPVM